MERAIEHYGVRVEDATYRLLEIETASILETRRFSNRRSGRPPRRDILEALRAEGQLPPIVVYRTNGNPEAFGLLDGVNRTYAHWFLGIPTIRAYELIQK